MCCQWLQLAQISKRLMLFLLLLMHLLLAAAGDTP